MPPKKIVRTPLTEEQIADAQRLKDLFSRTPHGLTQGAFGHHFEIGSQGMVWQYLNGKTALNIKAASGFASGLGCKVSDFSPKLAASIEHLAMGQANDNDEFTQVRRVDVSVSAGHGVLVLEEPSRSALTFRRSFLRDVGVTPDNAVIVNVKGGSMEPTIPDGAVLLVNTAPHPVISGEVYAFRQDGHLYVKRLHRMPDSMVKAVSDNPDRELYPDMNISAYDQETEVIGRCLWMGARL